MHLKLPDLMILGFAGIAAWWLLSTTRKGTTAPAYTGGATTTTRVANNSLPGQPGWGWSYFSDGTSIGPDGTYYFEGQPVYGPGTRYTV